MDWYLHAENPSALRALRHEVRDYLTRHAEPGSDTSDAELVVEELVGNAVRHAGGPVWVSVSWREVAPTLRVLDLGPGFDPATLAAGPQSPLGVLDTVPDEPDDLDWAEGGRGLLLVTHLATDLAARAREVAGMDVSVTLPVKRRTTVSHDPPRHTVGALPALSEAEPGGGFGKESFLRALIVQLAQAVEHQHGPDAADAAVAQVGMDVGGQMEREFRLAESVVGRMRPEQLARCYVRLKHAIDGGFYVVEVTDDTIVLGNRRCPFGDVVRLAPSLCRMTSSVFGGIAAGNSTDGAAVLLEERIAVGDPGCRVVVHLGAPPASVQTGAHAYAPRQTPD